MRGYLEDDAIAAEADAASTDADRAYQFSLALVQLVGAFPDGHVSSGPLAEDIPDCGTAAGDVRAKLKHDHIGGGFGITLALLDNGQLIVTQCTLMGSILSNLLLVMGCASPGAASKQLNNKHRRILHVSL